MARRVVHIQIIRLIYIEYNKITMILILSHIFYLIVKLSVKLKIKIAKIFNHNIIKTN